MGGQHVKGRKKTSSLSILSKVVEVDITSDTSVTIVDKLIEIYEDISVIMQGIAESVETDGKTLSKLATAVSGIEASIEQNPNTPNHILEKWLKRFEGEDEEHRGHIVGNPSLDIRRLKKTVQHDQSVYVREKALLALAKRAADRPQVSTKELLSLYQSVQKIRTPMINDLRSVVLTALIKHPRFPNKKRNRPRK